MRIGEKVLHLNSPALGFENVLIVPGYSEKRSRHSGEINLATKASRFGPDLNFPIASAGMSTVSEEEMAVKMAQHGGIAEVHRNNTPKRQAEIIRHAKEKTRGLLDSDPLVISSGATVSDVKEL